MSQEQVELLIFMIKKDCKALYIIIRIFSPTNAHEASRKGLVDAPQYYGEFNTIWPSIYASGRR